MSSFSDAGQYRAAAVGRISLRLDHPTRIVLLEDVPTVRAACRAIIEARLANVQIVECENGDEAWNIIQASPPDLFISDLTHPGLRVEEMVERLAGVPPHFPVLVVSAYGAGIVRLQVRQRSRPGPPMGFLEKPFLATELWAEIERLISTRTVRQQTCPRIILVDDEEFIHEMVDLVLRESLTDYTLVKFLHRDEAWQELLREQPDLLITDMLSTNVPGRAEYFGMSGGELLERLAAQRVNYPILVTSGSFSVSGWEAYAKRCARPHLNVSFLTKPYTVELFRQARWKCLGPGENFRSKAG